MKRIISLLLAVVLVLGLTACAKKTEKKETAEEYAETNFYVLSGPTGIGAANLKDLAEKGQTEVKYNINIVKEPSEIVAKISNKEADIAAVATNLAAKIYNTTNGGVTILAVNTLGVLNVVVPAGVTVDSLDDLKGKKVYTTGAGSNPEYIINYLLEKNNIDKSKDIKLEYKAEGTELLTVWATDPSAIIIAPQPVATALTVRNQGASIAIDLTKEWEKVGDDSALMQGCVVVRTEFLKNNPKTVKKFLEEYKASVEAANSNLDTTAALCESYGIVEKAAIAKKAIPNCNLCFITGKKMKTKLSGFLAVMFAADKTSIGGKMPSDDFYYAG